MSDVGIIRRGYVDVGSLRLHYRAAGQPGLPVLLLLHQSPSSSVMYELLMGQLSDRFQLLAPDTPGFGSSDALEHASIAGFAGVIHEFMAMLEVSSCFVFGHHTGASIAVQLEHDFPGTAIALALSGPPLLTPEQQQSLPQQASPFPVAADGSHLLSMWQRMRAKDPGAPLALTQREVLSAFAAGEAYQASYLAVTRQDFAAQLPSLNCPVLVFAGDQDPLYAAVAPSLALLRTGSTVALEGGERTYVCERQAGLVATHLTDFFLNDSLGAR